MKAVNKWLKRQRWSISGHQRVTKRPPSYLTVATKQPPIDPKVVTKRSPNGHKLIGKWAPSGHQLINWSPSDHRVILKRSTSGSNAISKWFQCLKWSTSAYKKVTKRPSWNLKVVPKWSPSSQQMIQITNLPSDHQAATKWFIGCPKVIMKWSQNDPISNNFLTHYSKY